jgi:uncharacterized lipoprotein YmbA
MNPRRPMRTSPNLHALLAATAAALALLSIAACTPLLAPRPDRSNFYVLTPIAETAPGAPMTLGRTANALTLGLGPVKFPDYVDRPEVVTRVTPNRLELSERDRWGEPLKKNFIRVLSQDLTAVTGARQVSTFPWFHPVTFDYQVAVDVSQFDTDPANRAQLIAHWEIKDPQTGELLSSGDSNIAETAQSGESAASTLSRAVGDLGREIAQGIQSVQSRPRPRPRTVD